MYGDRLYQLDLRFEKTFEISRTRLTLNGDVYNALNANTVLAHNNNFSPGAGDGDAAVWLTPSEILPARFIKLGFQLRF